MCTIMAVTGNCVSPEEFEKAFARTKYRGPDDTRIEYRIQLEEWEGCDVNDPSARVLSNYGASGV